MKKRLLSIIVAVMILLLSLPACAQPAPPATPEEFYQGSVIRFIVPYDPGGTYDLWARGLAPYLKTHTGADAVLVENMAGAGGLVGGGHLYTTAKPDGLTIGILPMSGMILGEMLGVEGVKYELGKFSYVGRVEVPWRALYASKASGFKSIADMQAAEVIRFGTVDPTSLSSVEESLLSEALGLKAKIVPGYKGSKAYMLATIAGKEVDAASTSFSGRYQALVKEGELTLVAIIGTQRHPDFPDVPTVLETPGLTAEGKKHLELAAILVEAGRLIVAPPGTPEDKVAFLEKALSQSLREPSLKEWASKQALEVSPLSAKESKALIDKLLEIVPVADRPNLKYLVSEKYF